MSNWPMVAASRLETLGLGTGTGTTVNSSASANVKGSYATIGTAGFTYSGFVLSVTAGSSTIYIRMDIAFNTGGADTIIVQDFFINAGTAMQNFVSVPFKVRIPSGATVKARMQTASGSAQTAVVSIIGYAQDFMGEQASSLMASATDFTNTQPPTVVQTGTTYTAWITLNASTTYQYKELYFVGSSGADTSRTASDMIFDVGIGSGGNEHVIAQLYCNQSTTNLRSPAFWYVPYNLAAASRIAYRIQCSAAAADTTGLACFGLVV